MSEEAIVTDLLGNGGDPISYNILNGTTCAKGSVMEMIDNRTVQVVTAAGTPIAGILASEKVAADGETQAAVITNCVAKMTAGGGTITNGNEVVASAAINTVAKFDTEDNETGYVIGYALETADDGETLHVRIRK